MSASNPLAELLAGLASALSATASRATLRLLEEALGQSDLVPIFEAEWSRGPVSG